VTSSFAVFEAAMWVKSTHLIKSTMFDNLMIKRENMEITEFFLHKFPSKRSFRHIIHSLLRRADAYLTHIASLRVKKVGHA